MSTSEQCKFNIAGKAGIFGSQGKVKNILKIFHNTCIKFKTFTKSLGKS